MEDKQWIRKLKKGDNESINLLFDKYYDQVYGYCYRHVTHRETAQDLTQEVFLRVFRRIEDYREYGKFENYLYVVASNLCKDFYKKTKILALEEIEQEVEELGFARTEQAIGVQQALEKLPYLERELIYLRYYQELRIKDIAKIVNLTVSTAKYHLKRGQEQLAEYLREEREDVI